MFSTIETLEKTSIKDDIFLQCILTTQYISVMVHFMHRHLAVNTGLLTVACCCIDDNQLIGREVD